MTITCKGIPRILSAKLHHPLDLWGVAESVSSFPIPACSCVANECEWFWLLVLNVQMMYSTYIETIFCWVLNISQVAALWQYLPAASFLLTLCSLQPKHLQLRFLTLGDVQHPETSFPCHLIRPIPRHSWEGQKKIPFFWKLLNFNLQIFSFSSTTNKPHSIPSMTCVYEE